MREAQRARGEKPCTRPLAAEPGKTLPAVPPGWRRSSASQPADGAVTGDDLE
jgi:hypothetical protein